MRRSLAVLAAVLVLVGSQPQPARADSITEFAFELADAATDFTTTGTGNADVFIDLSRVSAGFLSKYAVLDVRISYDLARLADPSCPPYVQLLTSDAAKTAGTRLRRSAVGKVAVQRVAIGRPAERYYLAQIRRNASGVSTAGPCVITASVPFTLKVKLSQSAPAATGFGFTTQLLPVRGDGEPSVAVDRLHGDIVYVSAPTAGPALLGGQDAGVDLWRSFDGGRTFTYSQPQFGNSAGGFDSHVVVADNGDVYLADLGAAAIYLGRSTDHGATFTALMPAGVDSDRQWLALYTPPGASAPTKKYVSYHDINVDNLPYECLIVGDVGQPVCNPMATDPVVLANATGNTVMGNQVFGSDGTIYSVFGAPGAPSGGAPAELRNIYLARSADGIVFADRLIHGVTPGHDIGGLFPIIAVDRADTLYVAWSERATPTGSSVIKVSWSTDRGDTWSLPLAVSPAGGSAVLPWIAAGAAGHVDIVWVGSKSASFNDPTADWYVYMAQAKDLPTGSGITVGRVTPQPVRYGTVCLLGLLCSTEGDDGRILLDFISVDFDSAGFARVAYGDSGAEGPADDPARPYTGHGRQTSGGSVLP